MEWRHNSKSPCRALWATDSTASSTFFVLLYFLFMICLNVLYIATLWQCLNSGNTGVLHFWKNSVAFPVTRKAFSLFPGCFTAAPLLLLYYCCCSCICNILDGEGEMEWEELVYPGIWDASGGKCWSAYKAHLIILHANVNLLVVFVNFTEFCKHIWHWMIQ